MNLTLIPAGMFLWWSSLRQLFQCPTFKWRHGNPFEDRSPIDLICGWQIFECDKFARVPGEKSQQRPPANMPYCRYLAAFAATHFASWLITGDNRNKDPDSKVHGANMLAPWTLLSGDVCKYQQQTNQSDGNSFVALNFFREQIISQINSQHLGDEGCRNSVWTTHWGTLLWVSWQRKELGHQQLWSQPNNLKIFQN